MSDDKRNKMHGTPVSNEEVLKMLGHPSEWDRQARESEKKSHLHPGDDDLGIAAIRGYGARNRNSDQGYLRFLEAQHLFPMGARTNLVSPEECERIRRMVEAETKLEIERYETRLAELERSPEAVRKYIGAMRRRIELMYLFGEDKPDESIEELRQLGIEENQRKKLQAAIINQDIERYTRLLETLERPKTT